MTVAELIKLLGRFDPKLPVAIPQWSEHLLLDEFGVKTERMCPPRDDGWIQNARPDKLSTPYLVIGPM